MSEAHGPLWPLLQQECWQVLPRLGDSFLAKYTTADAGYVLLITDGSRAWSEQRDADYVTAKSDVWASCVEAEVQQMAQLVLRELCAAAGYSPGNTETAANGSSSRGSVAMTWSGSNDRVTLCLSTCLEGLPYTWTFELEALQQQQILPLVTVPLAVQLQALTAAVQLQDQQLQRLRQKLADLTPDGGRGGQQTEGDTTQGTLRAAADRVLRLGPAAVLAAALTPAVYEALRVSASGGSSVSPVKPPIKGTGRPPRPKRTIGLPSKPRPATNLKDELLTEEDQQARRATIQAMTAPSTLATPQPGSTDLQQTQPSAAGTVQTFTAKPAKKKKKLNI